MKRREILRLRPCFFHWHFAESPVTVTPMKNRFLLFLLLLPILVMGQNSDTLLWLKQVEIKGNRITYPKNSISHQVLDTTAAAKILLADVTAQLSRESGVFVKSYGQGGVATISSSGMAASHTALLWNGIKLNSPMLGVYDFSLIPSFLLDKVTMQYGGSGSLQGSGSIGGAVLLESGTEKKEGITASVLAGVSSFGGQQVGIQSGLTNGNVSTNTRVYWRRAENDITYLNQYGETIKQKNAESEQQGFSQEFKYGGENNNLTVHGWYLKSDYKIPPHMLQKNSSQRQQDEGQRYAITWNFNKEKASFLMNAGFVQDKIRFIDTTALLDERSRARSIQFDGMYSYFPRKYWKFDFRLSAENSMAITDAYPKEEKEVQVAGIVGAEYRKNHGSVNASLRSEITNGVELPLLPSFGANYQINTWVSVRAEGALVYRVPTLNDRYWKPGGNPNLNPEKGRALSGGIFITKKARQIVLDIESGVFDILLNDAIVWFPQPGGFYGAENIQQIHSSGINGSVGVSVGEKNWKGEMQFRSQWNSSIITKTNAANASSLSKQQIYTPKVIYKGKACIEFKKIKLNYYINYSGYRYTVADDSRWLNPYLLSDIAVSFEKKFGKITAVFTVAVNNIEDSKYQVIANRAMAGRNYQAGMLVKFHQGH